MCFLIAIMERFLYFQFMFVFLQVRMKVKKKLLNSASYALK